MVSLLLLSLLLLFIYLFISYIYFLLYFLFVRICFHYIYIYIFKQGIVTNLLKFLSCNAYINLLLFAFLYLHYLFHFYFFKFLLRIVLLSIFRNLLLCFCSNWVGMWELDRGDSQEYCFKWVTVEERIMNLSWTVTYMGCILHVVIDLDHEGVVRIIYCYLTTLFYLHLNDGENRSTRIERG